MLTRCRLRTHGSTPRSLRSSGRQTALRCSPAVVSVLMGRLRARSAPRAARRPYDAHPLSSPYSWVDSALAPLLGPPDGPKMLTRCRLRTHGSTPRSLRSSGRQTALRCSPAVVSVLMGRLRARSAPRAARRPCDAHSLSSPYSWVDSALAPLLGPPDGPAM